jgi:hypothetical protein
MGSSPDLGELLEQMEHDRICRAFQDAFDARAPEIRLRREDRLRYFHRMIPGVGIDPRATEYAAAEALEDRFLLFKGPGHVDAVKALETSDWFESRDMFGNTKVFTAPIRCICAVGQWSPFQYSHKDFLVKQLLIYIFFCSTSYKRLVEF